MEKNILIIDDNPDARELENLASDLEYELNQSSSVSITVNLAVENPLQYIQAGSVGEFDEFFKHLDTEYLGKKLDMLLCDFNLHADHKHIAFYIIDHVRQKNRACSIILFTGSPLKELIRLNNNDLAKKISDHIVEENQEADVSRIEKKLEELRKEEEPAEELMNIAVKSNISAIVSRKDYEEKAKELIKSPSLILLIENYLAERGDMTFRDGNAKLDGLSLGEVARHIREQTEEGVYFTNEIIQISLANMVRLMQ